MNSRLSAAEILRHLVAIATPSAVSNQLLIVWVQEFLMQRGWDVQTLRYADENDIQKANLIARPFVAALSEPIELAFVCHTDTVPVAANWSSATDLTRVDDQLHGCGACDVKGALACFLAAVSDLTLRQIAAGTALILTADEEIGCKGMERLLEIANLHIRAAIVSEPTSMQAGIAGKGYGLARVVVTGREAHSAFPQQGVSAISVAARLIAAIEDRFESAQIGLSPNPLFDPPHTTLNIGIIEGGSAKNIIAGRCSFLVEWRAIFGEDSEPFQAMLRSTAKQVQEDYPRAEIVVEMLRAEPGFSPVSGGRLRARLEELLGSSPMGISFGSEATRIAQVAEEVIVIGPGDMRTAHSDRERVPIAELELWTNTLRIMLATRQELV